MRVCLSFLLVFFLNVSFVSADSSWAVLQQTAIQTVEHARRLNEAIETAQLLQSQVADTQQLLDLAVKASEGIDGLEFLSDFRNIVLETNDLINTIGGYVNNDGDLFEEWGGIFGSLDAWVENSVEIFENIDMSDKVNARGYSIADSYQELYQNNSENIQNFIANAKNVSEKGALKQIAEEMGHLMQMENQVVYLLSEQLRSQSVENSNKNLERKEEIIKFEQENEGVRRFINIVSTDTFGM